MNYLTLAAEIAAPAYSGLSDAGVADLLNAPIDGGLGDAPILSVQNVLLLSGEWGAIKLAARGTGDLAILCENVLALFDAPDVDAIGFGDSPYVLPAVTYMLSQLVGASLVSQASADAILALGHVTTTRAAQIGWTTVTQHDIAKARSL